MRLLRIVAARRVELEQRACRARTIASKRFPSGVGSRASASRHANAKRALMRAARCGSSLFTELRDEAMLVRALRGAALRASAASGCSIAAERDARPQHDLGHRFLAVRDSCPSCRPLRPRSDRRRSLARRRATGTTACGSSTIAATNASSGSTPAGSDHGARTTDGDADAARRRRRRTAIRARANSGRARNRRRRCAASGRWRCARSCRFLVRAHGSAGAAHAEEPPAADHGGQQVGPPSAAVIIGVPSTIRCIPCRSGEFIPSLRPG